MTASNMAESQLKSREGIHFIYYDHSKVRGILFLLRLKIKIKVIIMYPSTKHEILT